MSKNKDGKDIVVMHNSLARHTILENLTTLSVQDQRVIAYLIATGIKNHANNEIPELIDGNVSDLAKMCGITGGDIYKGVREAVRSLMKHVISYKDPEDGKNVDSSWLAWGKYHEKEGSFTVEFPKPLRRVLSNLHKHRTEIDLVTLLGLGGGAYALRLYQIAKSWQSAKGWTTSIEELRKQLGVKTGTFRQLCELKKMILDYSLKTINTKSDIIVTYKQGNVGRKWTHVTFTVLPVKTIKMEKTQPQAPKITDLPAKEQQEVWAACRETWSDLPKSIDWQALWNGDLESIFQWWQREKDQAKFDFFAEVKK